MSRLVFARINVLGLCVLAWFLTIQPCAAQDASDLRYGSSFIDVGSLRLHYLDFGGEGLPFVLVHSEAWDAFTFEDFGPRFADGNRVLAVTRPGYGQSEGSQYDVKSQGEALIDFLDALDIDRAAFAGNASVTSELTYLAEHHPARVAGVIYFTGLAQPWLEEKVSDPTRAFEMFRRASPSRNEGTDRDLIARARETYRPEFARADDQSISVPALAFVARSGTMGNERGIGALAIVGSALMNDVRQEMPPSPERDFLEQLATDEDFRLHTIEQIADSVARQYFLDLAHDDSLQTEIYRYHHDVILPAELDGQQRLMRAFDENLELVRLDVSQVVGYEYRNAPQQLEPHVRRFLRKLDEREGSQ